MKRRLPWAPIACLIATVGTLLLLTQVGQLRLNPRGAVALANLGVMHQQREEFDEAIRYYQETLQVAPREVIALKGLGEIALARGDLATAVERFRQATEAKPKDAGAWNNWGVALGAQGELAEAEQRFRRAIAWVDQPNAEFHVNLARALIAQRRVNEAHHELTTALAIAPDSATARELLQAIRP